MPMSNKVACRVPKSGRYPSERFRFVSDSHRPQLDGAVAEQLLGRLVDPVIWIDADGIVRAINQAATKLLDCPSHIVGQPAARWISLSRTSIEGRKDFLAQAIEDAVPLACTPVGTILSRPGREGVLVECSISPVGGVGTGGIVLVLRPLSQLQREAYTATRASEGRWLAFADNSGSPIYLKNEDGKYLYVNRAFAGIFGLEPRQFEGLSEYELLPTSPAGLLRARDREQMRSRSPGTTEDELKLEGGSRTFVCTRFVFGGEDGSESVLCCIGTDVTEFRDLERQLRAHQQELAHVARLSLAGELASGLAHELNQPLGAALNLVEAGLLRAEDHEGDIESISSVLDDARAQIVRAGEIIKRLRRFVKKDDDVEVEVIDLRDVANRAIALTRHDLENLGVQFELERHNVALPVQADSIQLEQVAVNFIRNALDAMLADPPEERHLRVAVSQRGGAAVFEVMDSGPGLAGETLSRLFEPFYTTRAAGMGLGLKISKTIIERFGGAIGVRNGKIKGAVSEFSVPLANFDL